MTMIDLKLTSDAVRDAARLANALRDGDADPLEGLMAAATADPGHFLGGALVALLFIRKPGLDPGLTLHEHADQVIAALERVRGEDDAADGGSGE